MRERGVGLPVSGWRYRLQRLGAVGVCVVSAGCVDTSRPDANGLTNGAEAAPPDEPAPSDGASPSTQADAGGSNPAGSPPSSGVGEPANTFRCGNWADQKDNFVNGDLLLSGLASTDGYEDVLAKSDRILAEFQRTANANAVRLPINEPTVLGDAWQTYKGAIDAAIRRQVRVILAYWAWHNGKADDASRFDAMWIASSIPTGAKVSSISRSSTSRGRTRT